MLEKEYQLKEQAASSTGIASVIPGRFQQTGDSGAVIFVHGTNNDDNALTKVFLSQRGENDDVHLIYAEYGSIENSEFGEQILVLNNGTQYDGIQDRNDYQVINFDQYAVTITPPNTEQKRLLCSSSVLRSLQKKEE